MAIDNFSASPLRHIATFVSSGTFAVPEGVSRVYATVEGARGNQHGGGATGTTLRHSGFVQVIPGKQAQVVIGASTSGNNSSAGTTSFDGAITVTGSGGSTLNSRYGQYGTGGNSSSSAFTALPTGAPAGAIIRVTSGTVESYSPGNGTTGVIHIYG